MVRATIMLRISHPGLTSTSGRYYPPINEAIELRLGQQGLFGITLRNRY